MGRRDVKYAAGGKEGRAGGRWQAIDAPTTAAAAVVVSLGYVSIISTPFST